jgi:hypothetical protein
MMNDESTNVSTPIHHSSLTIHHFGVPLSAALCYGLAILLLGAGVLAAWSWRLPDGPPRVARDATAGPAAAGPERVGMISGAVDCRWADARTAIEPGAAVLAGRRFVLASGLLQIWYESHVEVILQGPAIYDADSPHGGFLSLGRLTARVENGPPSDSREPSAPGAARRLSDPDFTIRTPSAILANRATMPGLGILGSSEFGVVVDSPDVTRVHVFRGLMTTQLAGGGPKNALALPLAANRSRLLARDEPLRIIGASRKARMDDVQFARRAIILPDGQLEQVAWLKAIGEGTQRKFVAVGSGEDFELPPGTTAPGATANPAAPQASSCLSSGASPGCIIYTCRLTFDLGALSLTTAMLRCQYVALGSIGAIRLNGKGLPCSRPAAAKAGTATKESGQFLVHGGLNPGFFVPGTNVLEIDVNESQPSGSPEVLWLRPEVSGIRIAPANDFPLEIGGTNHWQPVEKGDRLRTNQ